MNDSCFGGTGLTDLDEDGGDVGASIRWYGEMLGFTGDPFPESSPHQFAILRGGSAEIMLQRGEKTLLRTPRPYRWNVYLRLAGGRLRELHARLADRSIVSRRLEQMFYGVAEFEITDPDGYVLCLSEILPDTSDLPAPEV